ncbi:hypothetical protein JCM1840_006172 [Sporobolomyces johnsonii]
MLTQALVNRELNAPFELTDIELDEPQPNEVLVKVVACGLCHTDLMVQSGAIPTAFPSVAGHEGAGIVVSVGASVKRVQAGDAVLLSFASCQRCALCDEGHPAGCASWVEHNFGRRRNVHVDDKPVANAIETGMQIKGAFFGQSSFARHCLVQESSCVKVPSGTDLTTLAPLGCGLGTGAGAILNALRPDPSSSLVIFGLGAVGFAALFAASYRNCRTIIVVDLFPSRLALAKELGAHYALDGKAEDVVEQIKALTGGVGARYAIEATGVARVLETAWKSVRYAGTVVSLGNPGPGIKPPFDINDQVNSAKIWMGCVEGDSNPPEFIPFLMKLYEEGKFPVDRLSRTFPVEQFDAAVQAMKSGEVIKPIITF